MTRKVAFTSTSALFVILLLCDPSAFVHAFVVSPPLASTFATTASKACIMSREPRLNHHDCNYYYNFHHKNHGVVEKRQSHAAQNMVSQPQDPEKQQLPFYLDAHTKGGVVVLGLVLFLAPLLVYALATHLFAMEGVVAGPWIAGTYVVTLLTGWLVTLLSRIVNKEMTYAKQLKDYENQVLAKRLEELDEDERQALLEDMERDSF